MDGNRRLAFLILKEISEKGTWSNLAVKDYLLREEHDDAPFIREIVYGVLRNQFLLDFNIDRFLKKPGLGKTERMLLRMGFYQMALMDGVADHAAVNETVELAAKFAKGRQGFVNAVLRSFQRDGKRLLYSDLRAQYSCAEWIIKLLTKAYGPEKTEEILKSSCEAPPFTVRINRLKTDRKELAERFGKLGASAENDPGSELCLKVKGSVLDSEEYRNGLFSVQGTASVSAVEMLAPNPGESLLDLCAAPGGKTCAAAELMENDGRILALDVHPHRVKLIEKEAARLGHTIIQTAVSDASAFDPKLEGRWDRVIADVPCSALGTIARDPEIKLRELTEDQAESYIKELAAKQSAILANACGYVKPGGTVLYSTCTVDPAENEEITGAFIKAHEGYTVVKSRLLLSDRKGQEGFYTCLIRRNDDQHRF